MLKLAGDIHRALHINHTPSNLREDVHRALHTKQSAEDIHRALHINHTPSNLRRTSVVPYTSTTLQAICGGHPSCLTHQSICGGHPSCFTLQAICGGQLCLSPLLISQCSHQRVNSRRSNFPGILWRTPFIIMLDKIL